MKLRRRHQRVVHCRIQVTSSGILLLLAVQSNLSLHIFQSNAGTDTDTAPFILACLGGSNNHETCLSSDIVSIRAVLALTWACYHCRTAALSSAPLWVTKPEFTLGQRVLNPIQGPSEVSLVTSDPFIIKIGTVVLSQPHGAQRLAFIGEHLC
ncbi:hypothetical protein BDN72DRAFT_95534 [Pluteus cervinus]|uniref:Uncharacterized protein n=1 Tax=Pluteus cervinus TaxID=181527 RepID=A0ACD3ANU1_9AGAR|nr:hypothetical protein BDN72DRAFT_95534 [Pluteus cervinus]